MKRLCTTVLEARLEVRRYLLVHEGIVLYLGTVPPCGVANVIRVECTEHSYMGDYIAYKHTGRGILYSTSTEV